MGHREFLHTVRWMKSFFALKGGVHWVFIPSSSPQPFFVPEKAPLEVAKAGSGADPPRPPPFDDLRDRRGEYEDGAAGPYTPSRWVPLLQPLVSSGIRLGGGEFKGGGPGLRPLSFLNYGSIHDPPSTRLKSRF